MSQKRQSDEGKVGWDDKNARDKRPRVPALKSVVIEATRQNAIQKFISAIEPLLRKVVKEEVESALTNHLVCKKRQSENKIHPSHSRSLQLQFTRKLSFPIFTGSKIEGEDSSVLTIALIDAFTGEVVSSGPESSMNLEIVVLEGDFEGDGDENWTFEEFQDNIVKQRNGKRPLLTGDVVLNLDKGICALGEITFTDNSSWTRSRKFRLGARVPGGSFGELRVREAKTEAFMVKDHRGELYKKHYPPSLADEVWRLEKIGKDGAFHKRLSSENINTVKDFLTLLCIDAQRLRSILGNGMSTKMWEFTVDHARTCTLDGHLYVYYPSGTQQRMGGVVFNVVGEVMGLLSGEQYTPYNELSDMQKEEALKLVKGAFEHWDDVLSYKDGNIAGSSSLTSTVSFPSDLLTADTPSINFSSGQRLEGTSFVHSTVSTPDILSSIQCFGSLRGSDDLSSNGIIGMELKHQSLSQTYPSHDIYRDSRELCTSSLIFDAESVSETFCSEDHLRFFDPETSSQDFASFLATPMLPPTTNDKAHTTWMILRLVLRWKSSIKRIVRKKKNRTREMERYG